MTIRELTLERYEWPDAELYVRCSKGTYVRALVVDVAAALGTVAHVTALRRVCVDPFGGEPMTTLEALDAVAEARGIAGLDECLLPADRALPNWPAVVLAADAAARIEHGQELAAEADGPSAASRSTARLGNSSRSVR